MAAAQHGFQNVLVATDFSPSADAALQQATWLGRMTGAKLVLAHVLEDLKRAVHSLTFASKIDLLTAGGELFETEIRQKSDFRLQQMIAALHLQNLDIRSETLLGEPFVELIHAVQQEGYDLLMLGTRGMSVWKQFIIGSTAKRLIRKCPSAVWIVKAEHAAPPRVILTATDFSDVSRKAVLHGLWLADKANAELHLVHVIDTRDDPTNLLKDTPPGGSLREVVNQAARQRLDQFLESLETDCRRIVSHLTWGDPWYEISRIATLYHVDLITIGTVGRSGIAGVLLGNTAERVLDSCDCSILTIKPDDYTSPIRPATWPIHP
jgi:universal stress protein E